MDPFLGIQGQEVFQDKYMTAKIENVCALDQLSFNTELTTIDPDYLIKNVAQALTLDYILSQSYHLCPISLSMNERGLTSVPDFVVDFDFAVTYPLANGNPSIQRKDISTTFSTTNKAYDQRSYTLDIKATSIVSQQVATTTILITLIDECRFATITPPDVPNMQLYLYQVMSASFSASSINMNGCNQIMYELEFISSTATTPTFVGFD